MGSMIRLTASDRHEFSGRIKNVGQKRADFVRVVSNLFTQTTKPAGQDSVFVKGSRIMYDSGVIALMLFLLFAMP